MCIENLYLNNKRNYLPSKYSTMQPDYYYYYPKRNLDHFLVFVCVFQSDAIQLLSFLFSHDFLFCHKYMPVTWL